MVTNTIDPETAQKIFNQLAPELAKINPDGVKVLGDYFLQASSAAKDTATNIKGVAEANKLLTDSNKEVNSSYDVVGQVISKTQSIMKSLKDTTIEYPQAISAASLALQGVSRDFDQFSNRWGASASGIETYKNRHEELIKTIRSGKGTDFLKSSMSEEGYSNFEKLAIAAGKTVQNFAADTMQAALQQKYLRDALFSTAAETGQLGELQKEAGGSLLNIDKVVADHTMNLTKLREASGLSRKEAIDHYAELMKIPGALQMMASDSVTGAKGTVDFSIALEKMSRATGISVEGLSRQTGNLRDNFNLLTDKAGAGDEALKFLASVSKASNQLGLDYKTLQNSIESISSSFKYFGNTSQDVVKGYYEIAKSLEQTGLSAKVSGEMAQTFVTQIGKLGIAQKAYVSQMTGGPGGLMGAFDIDLKLREGKFKEVFDQAKETMKANLGELVSLKEASQSPEAASQYMKQITMLQSGPLGQLASTPEAAERLIDAFKEGMPQDLGDNATAAKEYFQTGKELQKKDSDVLSDMLGVSEDIQTNTQITAYNTMQLLMGNRASGVSFFGKDAAQLESYLKMKEEFSQISEKAGTSSFMGKMREGSASANFGRQMELTMGRGTERVGSVFNGTISGAQEMIERIKSSTGKTIDDIIKEAIQEKTNKVEELKKKGASKEDVLSAEIDLKKAQEAAANPDMLSMLTGVEREQAKEEKGKKPGTHLATAVAHVAKAAEVDKTRKPSTAPHEHEVSISETSKGVIAFCSGCHEKIKLLLSKPSSTTLANTPEAGP